MCGPWAWCAPRPEHAHDGSCPPVPPSSRPPEVCARCVADLPGAAVHLDAVRLAVRVVGVAAGTQGWGASGADMAQCPVRGCVYRGATEGAVGWAHSAVWQLRGVPAHVCRTLYAVVLCPPRCGSGEGVLVVRHVSGVFNEQATRRTMCTFVASCCTPVYPLSCAGRQPLPCALELHQGAALPVVLGRLGARGAVRGGLGACGTATCLQGVQQVGQGRTACVSNGTPGATQLHADVQQRCRPTANGQR